MSCVSTATEWWGEYCDWRCRRGASRRAAWLPWYQGGFNESGPLALLWQISEALGFCLEAPFRLNRSGEDGADRELERRATDVAFAVFG